MPKGITNEDGLSLLSKKNTGLSYEHKSAFSLAISGYLRVRICIILSPVMKRDVKDQHVMRWKWEELRVV